MKIINKNKILNWKIKNIIAVVVILLCSNTLYIKNHNNTNAYADSLAKSLSSNSNIEKATHEGTQDAMHEGTQDAIQEATLEATQETTQESADNTSVNVSEIDLGEYVSTMSVGEKQLLSVTVLPLEKTDASVTYSSSNTAVATVNGMGRIAAINEGTANIIVECENVKESFELTVTKEKTSENVEIKDIEIGEFDNKIYVNKTQTISASIIPNNTSETSISYSSSNIDIAKVSSGGEVRGISKGEAIIYVKAGAVTKELPITVSVETVGIKTNSTYIVLKPNQTFELTASAQPQQANQNITYSIVDDNVAQVSASGVVTAKNTGSTTILAANGDFTTSLTVIVNENYKTTNESVMDPLKESVKKPYEYNLSAKENPIINEAQLNDLYLNSRELTINGEGYTIKINGKNILNYSNEFLTDINLKSKDNKSTFVINNRKSLCGEIFLSFQEKKGRYVYLYNDSKKKYELLDMNGNQELQITSAGKYMITNKKISFTYDFLVYILIAGIVVIIGGTAVYIVVKKKYWFW